MSLLFTVGCFMLISFVLYTQQIPTSLFDQICQISMDKISNLDPFYITSSVVF